MARQIRPDETIEDLHEELDYTEARLLDEPDAAALAPKTETWRERLEATEQSARALRREETRVQAALDGANFAADVATDDFGGALLQSVRRDRGSAPWRAHFRDESPSVFKRLGFGTQVTTMRGWLTESKDATLEAHRVPLERATGRGEAALARDAALGARRGNVWAEREALAAYLTRERDALEDELGAIAREKGHDRYWARSFFRATPRPRKGGGGGTPT